MAITCKVCSAELDAFSGGRCRQCRQLVCGACIAEGSPSAPGGLLCKDCAAHQVELPKELPPQMQIARRRYIPAWGWALIAVVVLGAFTYVVVRPYLHARRMISQVVYGDEEEYFKALDELAISGGGYALGMLERLAKGASQPTRLRATRAIGAIPGKGSLTVLDQLRVSPKTPKEQQSVIFEAYLEHQRRHQPVADAEK